MRTITALSAFGLIVCALWGCSDSTCGNSKCGLYDAGTPDQPDGAASGSGGTSAGGSGSSGSGGSSHGGSGGSVVGVRGGGGASGAGGRAGSGGAGAGAGGSPGAGGGGASGSGGGGGTSGSGGSGGTGGSGSATGQWVLGYYVGYQIDDYPIDQIDWSGMSHVAFAPLLLKPDYSLDFSFDDSHGTGEADAKALAQAAHAHGVTALLMLGGAGAGTGIAAASAAPNRTAFVQALLAALDTLGYDGLDLDWEDHINMDDFIALAQRLRVARPGIVLSVPTGPVNPNIGGVDPKLATLAAAVDRVDLMTYYPATAVAGSGWSSWFNCPLSGYAGSTPVAIDDQFQRYVAAGVPKQKLGMGLGAYAICYTGGITAPRQPTDGSSQRIVGGDNAYPLSAFFAANSTFDKSGAGERKLDDVAKVPYLSLGAAVNDPHCGASTQYISYDDEASILAKGKFSKDNGYGGIIVWTIQQAWLPSGASGGRARNALMQALKQGFLDR